MTILGGGGGGGPKDERRRELAKAKAKTLGALEDGAGEDEGDGKGLFALPFMARALKKKRAEAEQEAQVLLEDIERADRDAAGASGNGGRYLHSVRIKLNLSSPVRRVTQRNS